MAHEDHPQCVRYAVLRIQEKMNVTSLTTANAMLRGLAESKSDGIIQVSMGGGAFASGSAVKDMALGAISIAEHVYRLAERYSTYVVLQTDHC